MEQKLTVPSFLVSLCFWIGELIKFVPPLWLAALYVQTYQNKVYISLKNYFQKKMVQASILSESIHKSNKLDYFWSPHLQIWNVFVAFMAPNTTYIFPCVSSPFIYLFFY